MIDSCQSCYFHRIADSSSTSLCNAGMGDSFGSKNPIGTSQPRSFERTSNTLWEVFTTTPITPTAVWIYSGFIDLSIPASEGRAQIAQGGNQLSDSSAWSYPARKRDAVGFSAPKISEIKMHDVSVSRPSAAIFGHAGEAKRLLPIPKGLQEFYKVCRSGNRWAHSTYSGELLRVGLDDRINHRQVGLPLLKRSKQVCAWSTPHARGEEQTSQVLLVGKHDSPGRFGLYKWAWSSLKCCLPVVQRIVQVEKESIGLIEKMDDIWAGVCTLFLQSWRDDLSKLRDRFSQGYISFSSLMCPFGPNNEAPCRNIKIHQGIGTNHRLFIDMNISNEHCPPPTIHPSWRVGPRSLLISGI